MPAKKRAWLLLALALGFAALATFMILGRTGHVRFAQDLELTSADVTREVVPGGTATLTLRLHAKHALPTDDMVFVHMESEGGGLDDFRAVRDSMPEVPATRWGDQ